jgi:hypothetical protein
MVTGESISQSLLTLKPFPVMVWKRVVDGMSVLLGNTSGGCLIIIFSLGDNELTIMSPSSGSVMHEK